MSKGKPALTPLLLLFFSLSACIPAFAEAPSQPEAIRPFMSTALKKSISGRIYQFHAIHHAPPAPGKIILILDQNKPIMALSIIKSDPLQSLYIAKRIRRYDHEEGNDLKLNYPYLSLIHDPEALELEKEDDLLRHAHASKSILGIDTHFTYFTIKSTDSTSGYSLTLLSKVSPGASVFWKLLWTKSFETTAKATYQQFNIAPLTQYKTLLNTSGSRMELGLESQYHFFSSLSFLCSFGSKEELFNHSSTSDTISLETVPIFYVSSGLQIHWLNFDRIHIDQALTGSYFFAKQTDAYRIFNGNAYATSLSLSHYFDETAGNRLFFTVQYRRYQQNTELITNLDEEITYSFGFQFGI